MKKVIVLLTSLFMLLTVNGCAHNYYNVPQETMAESVKVLGVLAVIVDTDSDVRHPQKEELFTLLMNSNRTYERGLVTMLKRKNSFYTVLQLDADPKAVLAGTLQRKERRSDASIDYNKYFWKQDAVAELIKKNSVDAVMLVVISGITKRDRIFSDTFFNYLDADYNMLIMTAQIVDAKGNVLWEYPNFIKKPTSLQLSYDPMINLQYPDFNEAKANMNPKIEVKFKSLEGIKRSFNKRTLDWLFRETSDSELYMHQFEEMVSLMDIERPAKKNNAQGAPQEQQKPALDGAK